MTKAKINKAIKQFGLQIQGKRGDNYFYFTNFAGDQIGRSVMVCYLNQQTIEQWVRDAEIAVQENS